MILAKIVYSFGDNKNSNPDTWTASIVAETVDQAVKYIVNRFSTQKVFVTSVETICDAIHSMTPEAAKTIAENYMKSNGIFINPNDTSLANIQYSDGLEKDTHPNEGHHKRGRPAKKRIL